MESLIGIMIENFEGKMKIWFEKVKVVVEKIK